MFTRKTPFRPIPGTANREGGGGRIPLLGESVHDKNWPLLILGISSGWLVAWVTDSEIICVVVALAGFSIALRQFFPLLVDPRVLVRQLHLSSVALVAILNGGALFGWFVAHFKLNMTLAEALNNDDFQLSIGEYARSVLYALLFAFVMALLARSRRLRLMESDLLADLRAARSLNASSIAVILVATACIELWLISTGVIAYRRINTAGVEQGEVSWFVGYLAALQAARIPLAVMLFTYASSKKSRNLIYQGIALLSGIMMIMIAFTNGRIDLFLTVALAMAYRPIWAERTPRMAAVLFACAMGFALAYVLALFNDFIRSSESGIFEARERNLGAVVSEASSIYFSDNTSRSASTDRSLAGMATRPLVSQPVALLQNQSSEVKHFGWGEEFFNNVVWVIPRFLFPQKVNFPIAEDYLNRNFGVNVIDAADSFYLSGYVNFGWLGVVIAPLFLLGIWFIILLMIRHSTTALSKILLFSSWPAMFLIDIGEGALLTWFSLLRSTVSIWLFCFAVEVALQVRRGRVTSP